MACALASLFGRKCFRTGFSAFPPALLAAFSAHLAHDFGYLLGVYSLIHLYEALYLVNHGIEEAVRGVQCLKKSPKLFMETYHKSMAGLERRRSIINLQFMLEMRKLEEDDGPASRKNSTSGFPTNR